MDEPIGCRDVGFDYLGAVVERDRIVFNGYGDNLSAERWANADRAQVFGVDFIYKDMIEENIFEFLSERPSSVPSGSSSKASSVGARSVKGPSSSSS
jgi:hypothetical protein